MKNLIIKSTFVAALIVAIFSAMNCTVDGKEFQSCAVSLVCMGYMWIVASVNRGRWIFAD